VGDVCSNDHEFGIAIVLGNLDLGLAHREFTAKGLARRPNLIEEIVVAQALEHQLGFGRGLATSACVRDGDARFGVVGTVDTKGAAALGQGFNGVFTGSVCMVADDKGEGDASLYAARLSLSSRSQQQDSQSKKDRP
jgi:hypothetical protein